MLVLQVRTDRVFRRKSSALFVLRRRGNVYTVIVPSAQRCRFNPLASLPCQRWQCFTQRLAPTWFLRPLVSKIGLEWKPSPLGLACPSQWGAYTKKTERACRLVLPCVRKCSPHKWRNPPLVDKWVGCSGGVPPVSMANGLKKPGPCNRGPIFLPFSEKVPDQKRHKTYDMG